MPRFNRKMDAYLTAILLLYVISAVESGCGQFKPASFKALTKSWNELVTVSFVGSLSQVKLPNFEKRSKWFSEGVALTDLEITEISSQPSEKSTLGVSSDGKATWESGEFHISVTGNSEVEHVWPAGVAIGSIKLRYKANVKMDASVQLSSSNEPQLGNVGTEAEIVSESVTVTNGTVPLDIVEDLYKEHVAEMLMKAVKGNATVTVSKVAEEKMKEEEKEEEATSAESSTITATSASPVLDKTSSAASTTASPATDLPWTVPPTPSAVIRANSRRTTDQTTTTAQPFTVSDDQETVTAMDSTTGAVPTTTLDPYSCRGRVAGWYANPDQPACSKRYFRCSSAGFLLSFDCTAGLFYNAAAQKCTEIAGCSDN